MNIKIKLTLLAGKDQEKGFSTVLAMGMGLISIAVGMTMIARGEASKVSAYSQTNTAKATAIAEAGIANSLSKLDHSHNTTFKKLNYDPDALLGNKIDEWSTATKTTTVSNGGCSKSVNSNNLPIPSDFLSNTVDNGNATYEIKAYKYTPTSATQGVGTLLIDGTRGNAKARLQVSMNITEKQQNIPGSFPGLYIQDIIDLANNDIIATPADPSAIVCKNCTMSNTTTYCPPTSDNIAKGAMGQQSNGNLSNITPMLGAANIPLLPILPSPLPGDVIDLGNIGAITLPRPGDVAATSSIAASGTPAFQYRVSGISISGQNNLVINTNVGSTNNPNGYPVHLYVTGDISVSGQANIQHNGTFGKFAIFGKPDNGTSTTSQTFSISGGSTSQMFVYAPDARVGINGGSSSGDITGVVWAGVWNLSNSDNGDLVIPQNAAASLGNAFGASWKNVGLTTTLYTNTAPTIWIRKSVD